MATRPPLTLRRNDEELDELYSSIKDCEALWRFRGQKLIPGEGDDATAKVFILGDTPSAEDIAKSRPFAGTAGFVLRQLMHFVGLYSTWHGKHTGLPVIPYCSEGNPPNVWLTHAVKFRPAGNRPPIRGEIDASIPFVRREWAIVGKPKVLIALGSAALKAFGVEGSINKLAGKPLPMANGGVLWPMIHPALGLRNEAVQPVMELHWLDFAEWFKAYDRD